MPSEGFKKYIPSTQAVKRFEGFEISTRAGTVNRSETHATLRLRSWSKVYSYTSYTEIDTERKAADESARG